MRSLSAVILLSLGGQAGAGNGTGILLGINGPIGPATSAYIQEGLATAAERDARLVVIEMDTPGGLDSSMRDIIKAILASPVPVVTYVSPQGSRAASAGTYILYASHVAAMAPATNLGAATPVPVGGSSPLPGGGKDEATDEADDEDDGEPEKGGPSDAASSKAINDAIAYIRSLAERRGRNADWAEKAVREAASLSAEKALELGVIDLVASDLDELLRMIHGREIEMAGETVTIDTQGLALERIEPDWRTRLLATITNPTVAYLLLLVGIYGLLFEGYNPGAVLPGVAGAICLLLAAYAFQILPVNFAGLGLIVLGVILMIAEIFVPSLGALGIGGIIAFVSGSIILMDTDVPGFGISRTLIGSIGLVGGGIVMAIVWLAVRARRRPVVSGMEQMIGAIAVASTDFDGTGHVLVHGEIWQATCASPVHKGQKLRITDASGLDLSVEPLDS
ncbi:MAG: nodulation protein NfeD [Gammaproteobacteria bacterium]|nr:MAG: nodulation protein NfeD [Gammaproteobacteria bacterium]